MGPASHFLRLDCLVFGTSPIDSSLPAKDFKSSFLFYRDVLGLTPSFGGEDDVYSEFQAGNALLALFQFELMAHALDGADQSLGEGRDRNVLVFEVADVGETVRQLQDKGILFLTQPQDRPDWGIRTAHLRDPEGNLLEVYNSL